jgi:hypothetical protein
MLASTFWTRKTGIGEPKVFVEDFAIVSSGSENTGSCPAQSGVGGCGSVAVLGLAVNF